MSCVTVGYSCDEDLPISITQISSTGHAIEIDLSTTDAKKFAMAILVLIGDEEEKDDS